MKRLLVLLLFGVAFFAIPPPDALFLTTLGPGSALRVVAIQVIFSLIAFGACLAGLWIVSIPSGRMYDMRREERHYQ